ncbi:cation diffusion facilitator family transporter [Kamptonema sp. UHCC 0994]|uniref:cation diffusion facilitator family transporter n=1 Tax=Kamptonema sp. UHCC 0994 TaxID=3031329 RepID=UPI0023BADE17|nr:cation diffusion facilitator family transporter [Kamptonema sp. UHCC 0994]MDF0556748.1 cation diffusion facilitator family transporter [Kamptonema sp. UHCC 0994]
MVHHHEHSHSPKTYNRAFLIGTSLNVSFVLVEAWFGVISHSLALLADAGHNLSDVLGLLLAWAASYLVQRPPSRKYTYGLRRSSILAALLNAILLLLTMGGITWEAIRRLQEPSPIAGDTVILVAGIGVVINTITALLFLSGREGDMNIRGAFLHMAADALVSVGVVLAGIAILLTGWLWFDPVISLAIVVIIVVGTWNLFKDSLELILDGVPKQIEPIAVRTFLQELQGVTQVHDLHIWAISTTETALTAHLVIPEGYTGDRFLTDTCEALHNHFGIDHSTLQIETGNPDYPCHLEPETHV